MKWISLLLMGVMALLAACTEQGGSDKTSVELSAAPPAAGSCVGWQQQLARGDYLAEVEYCLREKAVGNYQAAQADARLLADWQFDDALAGTQLRPVIETLVRFNGRDELVAYLRDMQLLVHTPEDEETLSVALIAVDYLAFLGNTAGFDAETGMYPNEHDVLLAELAGYSDLSGATFAEQAPGSDNPQQQPYVITAHLGGRDYRTEATDYGDWYDVAAVITLLNTMAVDHQSNYRYVVLPAYDQFVNVWVAPAQALASLVKDGLVVVSDDVKASMVIGKAAERKALSATAAATGRDSPR